MTFPIPANYYLRTPKQFETEITSFGLLNLVTINYELTYYLEDVLVDEKMTFRHQERQKLLTTGLSASKPMN